MMTKNKRIKSYKQKTLNRNFAYLIITNLLFILMVFLIIAFKSTEVSGNNKIEDEDNLIVYESKVNDHNAITSSANASTTPKEEEEANTVKFSRNLSDEDKYLLAKIAMAEAEGESFKTKVFIIFTILNRVESEAKYFPDTIEEVIFQNNKGVYQFSPVAPGGRWWRVEPNEECWRAIEFVNETQEDISNGALYFEACKGESWHSRNLELICQSDNTRFYK